MESNLVYYVALLALFIIGVMVVKRVASCLVRSIVTLLLVIGAIAIYYFYFRQ